MFGLSDGLRQRREAGLYRTRLIAESAQGVRVRYDGREYLSFCSNDYLGLAGHPDLRGVMCDAARDWGVGAGASHLLGGHSEVHAELEATLAAFTGAERALLFSTGYMANLGVLAGLVGRGDWIIQDKLNHASLIDGGLLSRARLRRYPHGDHAGVERLLDEYATGCRIVATDAVGSSQATSNYLALNTIRPRIDAVTIGDVPDYLNGSEPYNDGSAEDVAFLLSVPTVGTLIKAVKKIWIGRANELAIAKMGVSFLV